MIKEKKEEIWLSPMTKAPTPTEKFKKWRDNTKTPPKTSIETEDQQPTKAERS